MKSFIFIIFIFLTSAISQGQSLTSLNVASSGFGNDNNSNSFTWSVGGYLSSSADTANFSSDLYSLAVLQNPYFIKGTVSAGDSLIAEGEVVSYDYADNYKEVCRATVTNGDYKISNLDKGKYVLYAIPGGDIANLYNPTYFSNKTKIEDADVINLTTYITGINIKLIDKSAGINKMLNDANVSIFPNPTSDFINIRPGNGYVVEKVFLYTVVGKLILTESKTCIDVKDILPGVYVMKILTNNQLFTKEIIVK